MTATRILIVGDAISRGSARDGSGALPATVRPSWRYWLWKLLREKGREVDFVGPQTYPDFEGFEFDQDNAVYGGNTTTAWVAERIADPILAGAGAVDVAIVFLGTEDAFKQVPIADRAANIRSIIAAIRAQADGTAVVLVQIPPTADGENGRYRDRTQIVPFNTTLAEIAGQMTTAAEPVLVVDCHTGFTAEMTGDGLKPNELGEQYIAGQLFLTLEPLLGGATATPPVEELDPAPVAGSLVAEFAASREEVSTDVAVTFSDRSTVDRKKMQFEILLLGDVDQAYVENALQFVPSDLFGFTFGTPVENTNWQWRDFAAGGTWHVPWPIGDHRVCICLATYPGVVSSPVGGAFGAPNYQVGVLIPAAEYAAGDYEALGQRLLHELLHTVTGLESSDAMRTSEGFLGWLADHPSPVGAAFIRDPAGYAGSETEIQGYWYAYLVEKYRVHPTLNSEQVTYAWDFGDTTASTERSPSHTYTAAGSYPVTLTVTSPWGTDVSETTTITVHEPTVPPVAAFAVSAGTGEVPLGVQFWDRSTGGTGTAWAWDFGDGGASALQNPTHVYTAPGVYSPALTVTNDGGSDTVTAAHLITALRPPLPAPAVLELSRAGYLHLMEMLADAFAYVELRDGAGLPLSPRIATAGRITWTVDPDAMQVALVVRILGTDVTLPQQLSGVAFYEAIAGGDALATEHFSGGLEDWSKLTLPADTLDVTVHVTVIAESVVPRIVGLTSANVSGETGTAMILNFRVVNVQPGMVVEVGDVSPLVVAGSNATIPIRVVKG